MADIREIIIQPASTDTVYETRARPDPSQIEAGYRIDEAPTAPERGYISIVDDVLTTGAHHQAAKSALATRFPSVQIVGPFIARRVPDTAPSS